MCALGYGPAHKSSWRCTCNLCPYGEHASWHAGHLLSTMGHTFVFITSRPGNLIMKTASPLVPVTKVNHVPHRHQRVAAEVAGCGVRACLLCALWRFCQLPLQEHTGAGGCEAAEPAHRFSHLQGHHCLRRARCSSLFRGRPFRPVLQALSPL